MYYAIVGEIATAFDKETIAKKQKEMNIDEGKKAPPTEK